MENTGFKITFKGKEVEVKQVKDGIFDVDLSFSEKKLCYLLLSRIRDRWALIDSRSDKVLCVDLYDDGTIKHKLAGTPDEERIETKLNPDENLDNTPLTNSLRTILEFESAIFSQKGAIGISAEKIIATRKALLKTTLKMLGFNSYRDVLKGNRQPVVYVGLRRAVDQFLTLDNIEFVKNISTFDGNKIVMARLPNSTSPDQAKGLVNQTISAATQNNEHTKFIDDLVMRNRDICEDFMKKVGNRFDVSGRYSDAIRQIALLYLMSNADLLPDPERNTVLRVREHLAAEQDKLLEQPSKQLNTLEKRILFANRQLFEDAFKTEELYAESELSRVRNEIPQWAETLKSSEFSSGLISKNVSEIAEGNDRLEEKLGRQKASNPFDKVKTINIDGQTLE